MSTFRRSPPKKILIDSTPKDLKHLVHYSPDSGVAFAPEGLVDSPVLSRCSITTSDDEMSDPSSPTMSTSSEPCSPPPVTRACSAVDIREATRAQQDMLTDTLSSSLGREISRTVASPPQPRSSRRFAWGRRANSLVPAGEAAMLAGQDGPPQRRATTSSASPFHSPASSPFSSPFAGRSRGKGKAAPDPPWYHADFTKKEANEKLLGHAQGTFVVRPSHSQPGNFAISVVHRMSHEEEQMVLWHGIILGSGTNPPTYRLGAESRVAFDSLEALVEHFQRIPYTTLDRVSCCLGATGGRRAKAGGAKGRLPAALIVTMPPSHSPPTTGVLLDPSNPFSDLDPSKDPSNPFSSVAHASTFNSANTNTNTNTNTPPHNTPLHSPHKASGALDLHRKLAKQSEYRARTTSVPVRASSTPPQTQSQMHVPCPGERSFTIR